MTSLEEKTKDSSATDESREEKALDAVSLYESCKTKIFEKRYNIRKTMNNEI